MRIVFVSSFAQQCGIATYTDNLGAALAARGHDVTVLAMELDEAALYCGGMRLPYIRCWTRGGKYCKADEQLASLRPDVIHVQHEYGLHKGIAQFSAWVASLRAHPVVMTLHTVPIPGNVQAESLDWLMLVVGRSRCVPIVHQEPAQAALAAYGVDRSFCIPHGSVGPFAPTERAVARARLRLPPDAVVAATLGFWTPGKRNDDSIHAWARLRDRGDLPRDAVFVLAGQPIGKSAEKDLHDWCSRLEKAGLADIVQIRPGFVDDAGLADYYGAADFVIANSGPTMYSTSGRGHLAMSYGAAVLAADVPLLHEFRNCGLVFGSHAQLEAGIVRLATESTLRAELRQRARDYAAQTAWSHVAAAHESVYKEVVR